MVSSKHIKSLVASIGIHIVLFAAAALVFMAIPGEHSKTGIINVSLVDTTTGLEFTRNLPSEGTQAEKKKLTPKQSARLSHNQTSVVPEPKIPQYKQTAPDKVNPTSPVQAKRTRLHQTTDQYSLNASLSVKPAPKLKRSMTEIAPGPPKGIEVDMAYPEYGKNPKPPYPPIAKRRGYEGTVFLLVYVGVDGNPDSVEVSSSSGFEILDSTAVKAVRMWSFIPGKENGKPVGSWVKVPLSFRLNDGQGQGST